MNHSFFQSLEGGDVSREGWEKELKLVGSAQDNMDVKAEATKAALFQNEL